MKILALPLLTLPLLLAACGGGGSTPTDTAAPTVSLSATQSGTAVNLSASASDNVGVSRVEFYRGSTLIATDTSEPYSTSLTVSSADNGSVAFTAKAYDAANNSASSMANVNVYVAPTRTDTLYQGVWAWVAADASGNVVADGAMILNAETAGTYGKVAGGAYTNSARTQSGIALLGPVTGAGELDLGFTYGTTTPAQIYLIASDSDGHFELSDGKPFFFGPGATVNRSTQQPQQAVYVGLLQASTTVPSDMTPAVKSGATAAARAALKAELKANRATPLHNTTQITQQAQTLFKALR